MRSLNFPLTCGALLVLECTMLAAPYRYDHVVIVIEENTDYAQVLGNRTAAPYINELADGGVNFTEFYAITHPSQPNYIQLFSGDHQGIVSNDRPLNYPFTTPNLGASLLAVGQSFGGYSEDLPAIGDRDTTGTDVVISGTTYTLYRRKHNPWANWQVEAGVLPIPTNQLPPDVNLPFTSFPTDYSLLPRVSMVVPNQQNDMHDGTVRMGDDWLRAKLSDYAEWAKKNNSLLIITFDEDNLSGPNKIPTVFYGAGLTPGTVNGTRWTLHNLLRTLEDMYGCTTHAARANQVRPITGVFPGDPPVLSTRFRQGLNGYAECADTLIRQSAPDTVYGGITLLTADGDTDTVAAGNQALEILVKFASIFGSGSGQVPNNATIVSAKLSLWTGSGTNDDSDNIAWAHRMLKPWSASDTWNSLTNGVSRDDVDATLLDSFSHMPELENAPVILDVTADIAAMLAGAENNGWLLRLDGGDAWNAYSSENLNATQRPTLQVAYTLPVAAGYASWQLGKFGTTATLSAPADDADADGFSNLVEYALNTNPSIHAYNAPWQLAIEPSQGSGNRFCFTRNQDAKDVDLRLEYSNTLQSTTWRSIAEWTAETQWESRAEAVEVQETGGHVTVQLPQLLRGFYRVTVETAQPAG